MPLPYADPTRPKSAFVRGVSKVFGSGFGQWFIKNVAAKTDPWLGRVSNGRLSWSLGMVPTATLRTIGAKSGQPREVQLTYFHDGADPIAIASITAVARIHFGHEICWRILNASSAAKPSSPVR
jgi:F420H(2)-dependent quinone reductase